MNRVAVRIAALTTVVGVGIGGVTQAQRFLRARSAKATPAAGANVAAAGSALLDQVAGNATAAPSDENDPFGRGGATPEGAAGDRYAVEVAGDETTEPSFTERPEGDDYGAEVETARGQSLDGPDEGTAAEAGDARGEPGLLEVPENAPPLGGRRNPSTARTGSVARTGFDDPETNPGDAAAPVEAQPVEAEPSQLAEEPLEPQAAPPAEADYATPEPAAQSNELPAEAPPVSSRRRNARPVGEPVPQEPNPLPQEPAASAVPEPIAEDPSQSRGSNGNVPSGDVGGVEGSGRPGQAELEGRQSHALELEKHFPNDAQVGQPAQIAIKLRNAGSAVARKLEIVDAVPQGTRLVATRPQAEQDARGAVRWAIAELKPGEEANVTMEVLPLVEGELGSVATVHYAAEASARAVVTRPVLGLTVTSPKQILIGQDATLVVKVTNTGTGVARGLVLSDRIPEGFSHPSGNELEREMGDLRPGETQEVQLTLKGAKAGRYVNVIAARGEGETQAEERSEIEVAAPDLAIELIGGSRRYLERPAKFTLAIANNGTAPARAVDIAVELPPGLDFVEATHYGQFDARSRTVRWSLDELPAGQVGNVELTLRPVAEGELPLAIRATGQPLASFEKQQVVSVEGIATTMFEVVDVEDPVEEGGETSYEVRVVNQGTKSASNVQIVAVLPDGMQAVDAEGPTRHQIDGQRVLFDPVERLAPKADTSFRVKVKALKAGEMRVNVQLMTGEMTSPLTEEESTRVYSNK